MVMEAIFITTHNLLFLILKNVPVSVLINMH